MPLQLDGQLTLSSAPTVGSSGPKRAMLVRLTEDSLDALSAELGAGKYPPVQFDFSGTPGITIGDQFFPVLATRETAPHEVYFRKIDASRTSAATSLRILGTVTGSFQVQRTEVSKRAQEKLRDRTVLAEQEKAKRHTLFIDSVDPVASASGKKRKLAAAQALGDNAISKLSTPKDAAARRPPPSTSTPISSAPASSSSVVKSARIVPSRAPADLEQRPSSTQAARPKLAKAAGAPPMRSRDGETLTSTFRGGVLARESKEKKPAAKGAKEKPSADAPAPKAPSSKLKAAKDWDGEPDDIPLAMVAKSAAGPSKAANGRAGISSSASSGSVALAKAREAAGTPVGSKAREPSSASGSGRKAALANGSGPAPAPSPVNGSAAARPSVASSKKTTQDSVATKRKRAIDDGDEEYAPGSRKTTQKTTQKTTHATSQEPVAKRKRPVDDGDDEYLGPGMQKKRKSVAPPAPEPSSAPRLLNGSAKKVADVMKKSPQPTPTPAPAPAPPPVTKLPKANEDRQLAKGLKFRKEERKEERKPEILTPNTSASSSSNLAFSRPPLTSNGSANGSVRARRRDTPTFTSTEDEEDEAEEGELRPHKKSRTSHSRSRAAAAPPKRPVSTWAPQAQLPTEHAALRARYHETYVEYTTCQLVFATQRNIVMRQMERADGEHSDTELIDEAALEKITARYGLVVDELQNIRRLLGTVAV